jgi:hypothetical protein
MTDWAEDLYEELKDLTVEQLTERVAVAGRELAVAENLEREAKGKVRLAEDERNKANRHYEMATYALAEASKGKYQETHGQPISDLDREAFENRWAAQVAERAARQAAWRERQAANALEI